MPRSARSLGVLFAVPLAAVLVVSGCSNSTSGKGSVGSSGGTASSGSSGGFPSSSGSGGASGSGIASGSGGASASGGSGGAAPSHAALTAIVLHAGDVPSSWTAEPNSNSGDDPDIQGQMASCLGISKDSLGSRLDDVQSDDFTSGQSNLGSSATSLRSQAEVDARVAVIRNPKADTCLTQALQSVLGKNLPSGAKIGSASFHIGPASGLPQNVVAVGTGTITVTYQNQSLTAYLSMAFITGRLMTASVDYSGLGTQVDQAVWTKAVTAVAQRAAAA